MKMWFILLNLARFSDLREGWSYILILPPLHVILQKTTMFIIIYIIKIFDNLKFKELT